MAWTQMNKATAHHLGLLKLTETSIVKLDTICRQANIMLVVARSYGLIGMVRISMKEHTVIESKPDHFLDDLRLHNPWPELVEFAKTIDLSTVDPVIHKHTPYIVILINLAEKWAKGHGGCLPSSSDFKVLNLIPLEASFKVSVPRGISKTCKAMTVIETYAQYCLGEDS